MKLSLPFSGRGSGKVVGLDIGSYSIKVVELGLSSSGFHIQKFATRHIPLDDYDNDEKVAAHVRALFDESGIDTREVYVAVSGQNVVIRRTALPKMPLNELAEAVKWDAREEILFPLEGAAVDYSISGETAQAGGTFFELLTVLAQREIVYRQISIVQKADLKILGITAFPFALWEYEKSLNPITPDQVVCFIDMGAVRTRIYFASDNDLMFSREIPNAGDEVTEALEGEYKTTLGARVIISNERAEELKMEYGLPAEDAEGETTEGILLTDLRERIVTAVDKQLEEMDRSIEYFRNLFKGKTITRVSLSGGASGLKGFYAYLTERLEIPVERHNPLMQTASALPGVSEEQIKQMGPSLVAAAGLAVGQCRQINLLPDEFRESFKRTLAKVGRVSIIPLVFLAMFLYSQSLRSSVETAKQTLQTRKNAEVQLQQMLASLDAPKKTLAELMNKKNELQGRINQLPGNEEISADIPGFMDEVNMILPANVALEKIMFDVDGPGNEDNPPNAVRFLVKGNVFGSEVEVLNTLEFMLDELQASPLFLYAKLLSSEALDGTIYTHPGAKFSMEIFMGNDAVAMRQDGLSSEVRDG